MAAATLGDLVNEVRYLLRSFTGQHDRTTYVTSALTGSDLTIPVADGDAVATGIVEIDDELLWVDSSAGGSLTVPPYGRGYQGTAAATHLINTQVLVDPSFPRQAIKTALAQTAMAVYPTLFQVKPTEFTFTAGQASYDLEADADRVLAISYQTWGGSGIWQPVDKYRLDTNANTTSFPSGRALTIGQGAPPGRTIRVLYAASFTEMTATGDTLAAAGHAESHRDVLVFGAAARLVQYLEPSRLTMNAIENEERAKYVGSGAASALTRQLLGFYEQRLGEERKKMLDRYPVTRSFRNW